MKMKKLICLADIQQLIETKQTKCLIPVDTIITPAARDLAEEHQIEFQVEELPSVIEAGTMALFMKQLYAEPDLLQELIAILKNQPYTCESNQAGFKLIHGKTVQYNSKKTNSMEAKQVLFDNFDGTKIELVKLRKGTITKVFDSEEIQFVIEGSLALTIDNQCFKSQKGDIHYYPAGSTAILQTEEETQLFVIKAEAKSSL